MEHKNEGNDNKMTLGEFNCTMHKVQGVVETKHFINVISIMLCQNSLWIMDWRISGEERTQISLSSPATTDLLAQGLQ